MKLRSALFVFLFVGGVVACESAGSAGDDADADGDPKGERGRRPSGSAAPLPGCSESASCNDTATDGTLCRAACDVACRKTHSHFSFWVNGFEVANSGGLGRHQGIAILAVELSFDDRFASNAKPELAWPEPLLPALPADVAQKMTDDGRFAPFAMCSAPTVVLDSPLFNHGRTLSRDPAHAANRIEMRSAHADGDATAADDPAVEGTKAWGARTKSCLTGVKDGHCDAVCGNCSYVLPSASLDPMRRADWSKSSSLVNGTGQCSDGSSYYGGPGMESQDSFLGDPYPNSFTHCAKNGCKSNDEAPTVSGLWFSDHAVVSGRYGHNSNSDAEAEYRAFTTCVSPGDPDGADACAACGTSRDAGRQDPCADQTNMAAAWWDRTANLIKDFVPAVEGSEGERRSESPRCAWANFSVSGM